MLFKHEMQVDREIDIEQYVLADMSAKMGIDIIRQVGKKDEFQTASLHQQITLTVHAFHPERMQQITEALQDMIDSEKYFLVVAAREIAKLLDITHPTHPLK